MFSKAIGRSNDSIPGFQFFKDILLNATTIHVEDAVVFKSRLIVAIESSYKDNNLKTQHPVIDLLSQTTKEVGHGGWLLQLHVKGKSEEERPRTDVFLATALYNIIGAALLYENYRKKPIVIQLQLLLRPLLPPRRQNYRQQSMHLLLYHQR